MTRKFDWITPAGLTRLLVISYFLAVSLGLIKGTGLLEFMRPLLPEEFAGPLMRGLVLTLSVLILTGIARRPAALILSLVVFFSSYTALYAGGDIGAFWRDLALVGAPMMTVNAATKLAAQEVQMGERFWCVVVCLGGQCWWSSVTHTLGCDVVLFLVYHWQQRGPDIESSRTFHQPLWLLSF